MLMMGKRGINNIYGYHITEIGCLDVIRSNGLMPMCGDRCQLIGDETQAVHFFRDLDNVNKWINLLYKDKDVRTLKLLRFRLNEKKYMVRSWAGDDFYLDDCVFSKEIDCLNLLWFGTRYPLDFFHHDMIKKEWYPLVQFSRKKVLRANSKQ